MSDDCWLKCSGFFVFWALTAVTLKLKETYIMIYVGRFEPQRCCSVTLLLLIIPSVNEMLPWHSISAVIYTWALPLSDNAHGTGDGTVNVSMHVWLKKKKSTGSDKKRGRGRKKRYKECDDKLWRLFGPFISFTVDLQLMHTTQWSFSVLLFSNTEHVLWNISVH